MAKAKPKTSNENTGELVLTALKMLTKNTGWTARTVVNFIKLEFGVNDKKLGTRVTRALKNGVRLGLLQRDRNRYRLDSMSKLVKPSARRVAKRLQSRAARKNVSQGIRIRSSSSIANNQRQR